MIDSFDLVKIAAALEGLEETIIFKLIDRAQFMHNHPAYQQGKSGFEQNGDESLFSLRLRSQEEMDALFGRFSVAEERPFCSGLPKPRRRAMLPDTGLFLKDFDVVNLTEKIKAAYLGLVPKLCRQGEDGHFGSSVEHDIYALQAIARRIHYGALYVGESKFRQDPDRYTVLIKAADREGLYGILTRREVENGILTRVADKITWAQARVNRDIRHVIDPEVVLRFYRECIIPLTKDGEVLYLLHRTVNGTGGPHP